MRIYQSEMITFALTPTTIKQSNNFTAQQQAKIAIRDRSTKYLNSFFLFKKNNLTFKDFDPWISLRIEDLITTHHPFSNAWYNQFLDLHNDFQVEKKVKRKIFNSPKRKKKGKFSLLIRRINNKRKILTERNSRRKKNF